MDAATITKLRPADDTAEAVKIALGNVRARLAETRGQIADLQAGHLARILNASAKDIQQAKDEYAELQSDVQDLTGMETALAARLADRERYEDAEALRRQRAAMVRMVDGHTARWKAEYPALAAALVDLLKSERAALQARISYSEALHRFSLRGGQVTAELELPPSGLRGAAAYTQLPSLVDGERNVF